MPVDVSKVVEMVNLSDNLRKEAKDIIDRADNILKGARDICPHSVTIVKSSYNDGSYLDRASTTADTYCQICGKKLESKTETHSWYG